MKKAFVTGLVLMLSVSLSVFARTGDNEETDVKSTEGVETNQQAAQTIKKSRFNSNPAKQKQKIRNKYLRSINKVDKSKNKKLKKERDLEFYNKRLEIKKQQLEELTTDENEKGENEQ